MPKLKVDHVVSFSSEDPVHIANNILLPDTSKKWKCQTTGEKSASIVLQLEKASVISTIDIGNEHSAYVEVLVSRSSNTEDFKVMLVMSSFMTPLESRQSTNINKVRMFRYDELQSPERDQKWDRVKIVCTQPFNRHVQYGLAFITLNSLEAKDTNTGQLKLGNFSLRPSSPDNLSVGSLFARRKELKDDAPLTAAAAIREASSTKALAQGSRSPQCKPRLKDTTSMATPKQDASNNSNSDVRRSRNRDALLYSKDEEEPNQKIDKLIEQKNKETNEKRAKKEEEEAKKKDKKQKQTGKKESKGDTNSPERKKNKAAQDVASSSSSHSADTSKRKLNGKNRPNKKIKVDRRSKPFSELLSGVTIVISGIQNPERATIRSEALALGAKYKSDWDHTSTHLICAFTNTPKFNQVKGKGKIVNRLWISDCHSQRKRLPWRRYALDSKDQGKSESEDEVCEQRADSPDLQFVENRDDDGTDTEGEIDRIEALQKAKNRLSQNIFSVDTDEENTQQQPNPVVPKLLDFLSNKILYIDKKLSDGDQSLLLQYITAYNGILVDDPSDVVDFAISSLQSSDILKNLCPDALIVSPNWIWECHNAKQLVSADSYTL